MSSDGQHKYLWIGGPLKINVVRGEVYLNGAVFGEGEEIIVHRDRSYVASLDIETVIDVQRTPGAVIRDADKNEIEVLRQWRKTAEDVSAECHSKGGCTVVVMGGADSGKTSFSVMLANTLLRNGIYPCFLDADPGQSTVGVPGFISIMKYREKSLWPRELGAERYYYIGGLSPRRRECEVISGIGSLLRESEDCYFTIVDTDGWFNEPRALAYKARLVRESRASHVVLLENTRLPEDIRPVYRRMFGRISRIEFLRPPPNRRVRPPRERIILRGDKLSLFMERARQRVISLNEVFLEGRVVLGAGRTLSQEELEELSRKTRARIVYAERIDDKLVMLVKGKNRVIRLPYAVVFYTDDLEGRIVGLINSSENKVFPAIIKSVGAARPVITLLTPYEKAFDAIIIGDVVITGSVIKESKGGIK